MGQLPPNAIDPVSPDVSKYAHGNRRHRGYPWPSPLKRSDGWPLSLRLTLRATAASWEPMRSLPSMPSPRAGKSWTG